MGKDHYYNAFGDDDGTINIAGENVLARAIDPHLVLKLLIEITFFILFFAVFIIFLFEIEYRKKINETSANVPDNMVLSVDKPESERAIVNASIVQTQDPSDSSDPSDPSDSGLTRMERKSLKEIMDSLETSKMLELVAITVALVLIVFLLLVYSSSGSILLSVIGMITVTGAFLKDQIRSEWQKERYDRILLIITTIFFMASSLSSLIYAKMGLAEGSIYVGPARIVGKDDSQYTNVEDETVTRVDLSVSWGGAWGCPHMDKTCYDKVQGALCQEKDNRFVRKLQGNKNIDTLEKVKNIHMRRLEVTEEDDEVFDHDEGGKEVYEHIEEVDDTSTTEEVIDIVKYEDGASEEFIEVDESEADGSDEEIIKDVYSVDGELSAIEEEFYSESADGTVDTEIEDLEYEDVDGVNKLFDEEVVVEAADRTYEDKIEIDYESTPEGIVEVREEVIDEKIDWHGNESLQDTDFRNINGLLREVSEYDYSEENTKDDSAGADYTGDDNIDTDGGNDDVELLKEELKEVNEENKKLKDEINEEEGEVEDAECVEEEEEEEVDELEDKVEELYDENTYSFEDDIYENDYWSGNNWDDQWGDYQCGELFDTEFKKLPAFDANTPPGDDEWPFVNIYGKCNSCDAYLLDYFASEHFNNIKAYEAQGKYYRLVGLFCFILYKILVFWQKKQRGKKRILGLIPNEDSNIV